MVPVCLCWGCECSLGLYAVVLLDQHFGFLLGSSSGFCFDLFHPSLHCARQLEQRALTANDWATSTENPIGVKLSDVETIAALKAFAI